MKSSRSQRSKATKAKLREVEIASGLITRPAGEIPPFDAKKLAKIIKKYRKKKTINIG